jgi:hypothetical protein
MRYTIIAILSFLCFSGSYSQTDSAKLVKYTPEFQFQPGIYLNFNQVRTNNPIQSVRIISNDDPMDFSFYRNLVQNKKIRYFDDFGAQQEVNTSDLWGYCSDGKIFIQYNGEFNRIPIIGHVCHFIADITVINSHYDPYYSDYYNSGYYNPYYSRPYNRTTKTKEMRQYLLEFETGKVLDFNRESVQVILMQEPELYDEFMKLKKRQQNDLLFFFLRRLNEKFSILIPTK